MASVMTPFPYAVQLDDSLRRARELMAEHDVRHLPVLRSHVLVGILSDRDIKRAMNPDLGLPPIEELFVRDIYVPDPYVVEDHAPLDDVLEHARERGEFMLDAADFHGGDGGSFKRGQEDAADGVAEGVAVSLVEGLGDELGVGFGGRGLVLDEAVRHFESG